MAKIDATKWSGEPRSRAWNWHFGTTEADGAAVHAVSMHGFPTKKAALAAGRVWAAEHGIELED